MGIIKTVDLRKTFFHGELEQPVLKDINMDIFEGDFAGIVGPSGSGKTTLLYCLSSLEDITSGQVFLMDKDIAGYSERDIADLRKTDIGFVFQFYNLVPNLTVYENILLAKVIADKHDDNIDDVLSQVGMTAFRDYYPDQLSGGMQQRVAIARALVNHPKIIFADEPTGNLDQKIGKEIMDLLAELNRTAHVTVVLVTHNEDYLTYCNHVFRLIDGRIV